MPTNIIRFVLDVVEHGGGNFDKVARQMDGATRAADRNAKAMDAQATVIRRADETMAQYYKRLTLGGGIAQAFAKSNDQVGRSVDRTRASVDRSTRSYGAHTSAVAKTDHAVRDLGTTITGTGKAMDLFSFRRNKFAAALAAIDLGTGFAETAMSGLGLAVGAAASMFTIGAAGIGAYAAAALPAITQVAKLQKLQAQAATGSKTAQAQLRAEMKKTGPAVLEFSKDLTGARSAYADWGKSLSAPVLAPLDKALTLVKPLLHDITPLVHQAADAFNVLMGQFADSVHGGGLSRWVDSIKRYVFPILVNLGDAVGHVITGIGFLARDFAPFATKMSMGLADLTKRFSDWAKTLTSHTGFQSMVDRWRQQWPLLRQGLGDLVKILYNIVRNLAAASTPANSKALWEIANPLLALAVRLSGSPQLVQVLSYILLIGAARSKILPVFESMKTGWNSFAKILSLLTGGKINLGLAGSADTMEVAAKQMNLAADKMLEASRGGFGGAGGGAAGSAERAAEKDAAAAAEGAAGGAGIKGLLGKLGSGAMGLAVPVGGGLLLYGTVVAPVLKSISSGPRGKNWFDNPFGMPGPNDPRSRNNWLTSFAPYERLFHTGTAGPQISPATSRFAGPGLAGEIQALGRARQAEARAADQAKVYQDVLDRLSRSVRGGASLQDSYAVALTKSGQSTLGAKTLIDEYTTAIINNGDRSAQAKAIRAQLITDFERQGVSAKDATRLVGVLTAGIDKEGTSAAAKRRARLNLIQDFIDSGTRARTAARLVDAMAKSVSGNGTAMSNARAARRNFINDLIAVGVKAPQARADVASYTTAVQRNGVNSDQAKNARRRLIDDLHQAGVDSKTSAKLVWDLTGAIEKIPKSRHVDILVTASGGWSRTFLHDMKTVYHAAGQNFAPGGMAIHPGMKAGGGPITGGTTATADDVPLWASRGEYMVKAASHYKYGSKAMDAVNAGRASIVVPQGYARGGSVAARASLAAAPQYVATRYAQSTANAEDAMAAVTAPLVRATEKLAHQLAAGGFAIVREAMRWLGQVPYVWGGTAVPGGADCSGFVSNMYQRFGIFPPRTSEAQGAWVKHGPPTPGGLAFYHSPAGGADPGHVAIVGFGGKVISQGGGMGPQLENLRFLPLLWTGTPPGGFHPQAGGGGFAHRAGAWTLGGLERLWDSVGGPPSKARLMAAIGLAESAGDPLARGPSTAYGRAAGLWQILGLPFPGNPFNPTTNARMALAKYRSQGLGAWATYDSGAYRQFYKTGAWSVPRTEPAVVHRGEMIVPADLAETVRSALTGHPGGPYALQHVENQVINETVDPLLVAQQISRLVPRAGFG